MKIISDKEFTKLLLEEREYGAENSKKYVKGLKKDISHLEETLEEERAEAERSDRKIQILETNIEVLEEERRDVRAVTQQYIENGDQLAAMASKKDSLERKEAKLKDREDRLGEEEEGEYKRGYADGVADGVRKINEVTAKDRENAMSVAMMAAASHSSPEVVKELNNNVKSLAEGTENQEG